MRFPNTLLPLATYARIMGITPPHFWQAASATVFPVTCQGVWYSHDWQSGGQVSRWQLAEAILGAEEEIARVLGYYPAPKWISKEIHHYPQHYRRDLFGNGRDIRGHFKPVELNWGKFIQAGRRAVTLVGDSQTVTYSDPDGDGYNELATITVAGITTTDACELKVYFEDKSGEQEWEIRTAKTKTLSGGTLTVTFDAWLLIDPDLQEQFPNTDDPLQPIDLLTSGNYVSTVDVYREYTDFTVASAEFSWQPKPSSSLLSIVCTNCNGSGCVACENTTQDGCFHTVDSKLGMAVPQPATYDSDDGQWNGTTWTECREPDTVKLWYYAGDLDQRFLQETSCDPLSHYFAQAISWLATARLENDLCGCNNTIELARSLRIDLTFTEPEGGSYFNPDDIINNPFGTKKGEVMAWLRIKHLTERVPDLAMI